MIRDVSLPVNYNENTLVLLVQNPVVVFAYWGLSEGQWRYLAGHGGLHLRLYQLPGDNNQTGTGELTGEVALPPFTDNWYFKDLKPAGSYYCELGFYGPDGVFYPVLRSNRVKTPWIEASRLLIDWLTVENKAVPKVKGEQTIRDLPGSMTFLRPQ